MVICCKITLSRPTFLLLQLTVKSDVTTQYKILLQGLITTEQRDPDVSGHVVSLAEDT